MTAPPDDNDNPIGSDPLDRLNVYGAVPPFTAVRDAKSALYGWPNWKFGSFTGLLSVSTGSGHVMTIACAPKVEVIDAVTGAVNLAGVVPLAAVKVRVSAVESQVPVQDELTPPLPTVMVSEVASPW